MARTDCRYFSGYKPCGKAITCDQSCCLFRPRGEPILVVHLEALGAVLRGTSILPAIKRRYPLSHITWVTQSPAQHLLTQNPHIDRILTTGQSDLLELSALHFSHAFVLDKSLKASGILHHTRYDQLFGFRADPRTGAILPVTRAANELWEIGLDDHRKFHVNKKTESQLLLEAVDLGPFRRDPYVVYLSTKEKQKVRHLRKSWGSRSQVIIGINTGCSHTLPYKKMSVEKHRQLIRALKQIPNLQVVLLGGPEDSKNNHLIAAGLDVVNSPTEEGLRNGLVSVAACDVVVTGDSLGMHMAIGLSKWVVAWFGPTCSHEIDLYDRGVFVHSSVTCGPCWKRSCLQENMCYDQVPISELLEGVRKGIQWRTSFIKQPLSEISSSPFL